jgi:hypothetical protein
VDLVDEQDVARLQVGEDRGEVPGAGDDRPGGEAEAATICASVVLPRPGGPANST